MLYVHPEEQVGLQAKWCLKLCKVKINLTTRQFSVKIRSVEFQEDSFCSSSVDICLQRERRTAEEQQF
jgi:hypothetical protein